MKHIHSLLSLFIASVLFFGFCHASSSAVITEQDLEKYKKGGAVIDNQTVQKSNYQSSKKVSDKEKQRWCDEGEKLRKQISRAQEEVRQADSALHEKMTAPESRKRSKEITNARNKKIRAERNLKEAQTDLDTLENRAHRNSIPPGWVRCQFE